MNTRLGRQFAVATVALCLGSLVTNAAESSDALPLNDILKLKGGKSIVFQPVTMKEGQTLTVTHLQFAFGDGSVRPVRRAAQLLIYSSTPNDQGAYPVLYNELHVFDRSKDVVNAFPTFTHPGGVNDNGIIAVLIGLLLPADQEGAAVPVPLPPTDSVSAEIHDPGSGTTLLLPAVQKVREAAAR